MTEETARVTEGDVGPEPIRANSGAHTHDASTEARVAHLVDLMARLRFRRGVTVRRLAKEWEVTEQWVRELSAEASKRVRAQLGNPDEVAAEVLSETRATFRVAHRVARSTGDPRSIGAAVSAGSLLADIAGIRAPNRKEISGPGGGPVQTASVNLADLTDAQLERLAAGDPLPAVLAGAGPARAAAPQGGGERGPLRLRPEGRAPLRAAPAP